MHVEAAKGWCELHNYKEAEVELGRVRSELHNHPLVLEARWQINMNLEKWDAALEVANAIVKQSPEWPNGWIYKGETLTEMERLEEAQETLHQAAERFPTDEIILYDLACVCCTLCRFDKARFWLNKAIDAGGEPVRQRALDDPDLGFLVDGTPEP
jgi:predicted Zn-dependent protease